MRRRQPSFPGEAQRSPGNLVQKKELDSEMLGSRPGMACGYHRVGTGFSPR